MNIRSDYNEKGEYLMEKNNKYGILSVTKMEQ